MIYNGYNFEQNGIFDTKVYFKPTDSHALLHKQSFHPQHTTFPGIIKSQLIRFARICKLEKDFNEATTTLFGALYRRGYSRRYLRKIKSQIKMQYYPPEEYTGMKPCNSKRCTICRHVNKNKTIHVNSKPIRLHANGNCNTNVAIYLLGCRQCPKTGYVGQTIKLRNRFINHLSYIRKNNDKKVYQHFNSTNHTLKDVTITILEIPKSAKQELLDKLERQWITKLNTFHSGLNSDAGNPGKDSCTFILQHHPSAAKLTNIARDWLDEFNENNPKLKKHPISLITANARNKNLSQTLVKSLLKPDSNDQT